MRGLLSPEIDEMLVLSRGDRLMASAYLLMTLGCLVFLGLVGVMWQATS